MLERFVVAPHLIHEAVDMSPRPRNLFGCPHRKILAHPYSIEMKWKFHGKWASQYLPWGHSRLMERGSYANCTSTDHKCHKCLVGQFSYFIVYNDHGQSFTPANLPCKWHLQKAGFSEPICQKFLKKYKVHIATYWSPGISWTVHHRINDFTSVFLLKIGKLVESVRRQRRRHQRRLDHFD